MSARKVQNILELSVQEQKAFVDSFDVVLCDCDGVMWLLVGWLPDTGEAVNSLKAGGKRVLFVTNNSLRTDEEYVERFTAIGVKNFQKNDIIHPAKTLVHYLKQNHIRQPVFSMCSFVANETLRKNGIAVETLQVPLQLTPTALSEITQPKHKVGAVLYDINLDMNYAQICMAIQYLKDADCAFIAGGTDCLIPVSTDVTVPGFYDMLATIEKFSRRTPVIICKPSVILGDIMKKVYEIKESKRCLFVGDSLTHDIRFGIDCGFQTLLVLTGTSTKMDMQGTNVDQQPDYYANSIADFMQLYKNIGDV